MRAQPPRCASKITARLTISSTGTPDGPNIGPPIIFVRSTPHSRHLRRPSRYVAPSRFSANGVVLHCEIIAHYTFSCPAHWARSRRSASRAPRSSRRPRTRHVPRSRTRDETRTASTYRCEPPSLRWDVAADGPPPAPAAEELKTLERFFGAAGSAALAPEDEIVGELLQAHCALARASWVARTLAGKGDAAHALGVGVRAAHEAALE